MITKHLIHCISGGTEYTYHLHTNKITTPSLCVYYGQNLYCPTIAVGTGKLNFYYNGSNHQVLDKTPLAVITYNVVDDPQSSLSRYLYKTFNISMSYSVTINNAIEVQIQSGVSSWTTRITLSAGGTDASMTANTRLPYTNCRLKIGSWTSSTFSVLGNSNKQISIPEAQWGV